MKNNFFNSIKFRLAVLFTIILFVFSGIIILLFNVAIDNYLSTRQEPAPATSQTQQSVPPPENDPQKDARARYTNQLESIKQESVYGLIALAFISLGMGYYISGRFLKPLNKLNSQIDKLKSENLGSQIDNPPSNEVGKTISYFNEMSLRLQKAFDQQSRFVQDASHELRTPLTILRTNIETVLDDKNASREDLRESMQDALSEIDSTTELANNLLALSKPESKLRTIESMESVLAECVSSLKDISKNNHVTVSFKVEEDLEVKINKSDIVRAIKNIIENGIKYSKGSRVPKVEIVLKKNNKTAVVQISDNGVGIPKEELGKIFDRFYRVDKSRDRNTGGFGLGLSITKKIISDHGGTISVTSKSGKTVFVINIPSIEIS